MLFDEPKTVRLLRVMVQRLPAWAAEQDDLLQEALIYLWRQEHEHPGHTRSWYVRGSQLHLRNLLRHGHSVDCARHRHTGRACPIDGDSDDPCPAWSDGEGRILSEVSARDIVDVLARALTPEDQRLLSSLVAGLSTREIAQRLRASHTAVNKRRRKIAGLALKLGIEPLGPGPNGSAPASASPLCDGGADGVARLPVRGLGD